MTTPKNDKFVSNDNDETKKPGSACCTKQTTIGTATAAVLWAMCMVTNDCWSDCKDAATKASIFGFGIFVLFMLGAEWAFDDKDETICDTLEALDKEFASIKTGCGKIGYLVYNFTVFATLIAELNAILDTTTPMWYRDQALYMYGFLMYSNAAGPRLWSVVHTLVFALYSDSVALNEATQVFMNPRALGLIVGYCGIAYEVVRGRGDDKILKEHLPPRSIPFFPMLCIPAVATMNTGILAGSLVIKYLVVGVCVLYCSLEMPMDEKRSDASWMERFGTRLFHASIWTQIALVLMESIEGGTGTRSLWIIGFLLYAHFASFEILSICFVWGVTILGSVNTFGIDNAKFPLATTIAGVRTMVFILALADHYLHPKKSKATEDASDSKDQVHHAATVVMLDENNAAEYVPLVDTA